MVLLPYVERSQEVKHRRNISILTRYILHSGSYITFYCNNTCNLDEAKEWDWKNVLLWLLFLFWKTAGNIRKSRQWQYMDEWMLILIWRCVFCSFHYSFLFIIRLINNSKQHTLSLNEMLQTWGIFPDLKLHSRSGSNHVVEYVTICNGRVT